MATIDWSVGEIAKNIGSVEDFVSFSKVCPSWQLAAVKENWVAAPKQVPWLALSEKYEEREDCKENRRGFFNLKRNTRYEIHIPQLGPSRSWGSSLGWIVTVTLDLEIHMINPLSGLKLRLPHIHTLKRMPRNDDGIEVRNPASLDPTSPDYVEPEWFMQWYVRKALVCKRNQQVFVAVIYGEYSYFAIARPGDESWSEVEGGGNYLGIEDAVYCNDQLIALNHDGSLKLCEFDWIQSPKFVTIVPTHSHLEYHRKWYLVESMGELLMVVRWLDDYDPGEHDVGFIYETARFDVYNLDFQKKWIELKNLGNMALFLGDSYSLSLSSTDLGCEANVIYYTDNNCEGWDFVNKEYGGHDIGIFNLKDKAIHPLAHNLASDDLRSTVSCPVWMIPSLF